MSSTETTVKLASRSTPLFIQDVRLQHYDDVDLITELRYRIWSSKELEALLEWLNVHPIDDYGRIHRLSVVRARWNDMTDEQVDILIRLLQGRDLCQQTNKIIN